MPAAASPISAAHERANRALLTDLPTYPRAQLRHRFTIPQRKEEGGPVVGYTTISEYVLPQSAEPADVESFYEQQLKPKWRLSARLDAGGPQLRFRNGDAALWIDPDGTESYQLEVAVNDDYYAS